MKHDPAALPLPTAGAAECRATTFSALARTAASAALVVGALSLGAACATPPPPQAAAPAAPPPAPIALEVVRARVDADVAAMRELVQLGREAARSLSTANARLQQASFFRRIPSAPTKPALLSNLRAAASTAGVVVVSVEIGDDPRGVGPDPGPTLAPGNVWKPDAAALLGRLPLQITLRGDRAAIAKWIDELPIRVERLVLIRGHRPLPDGELLVGEAFFERTLAPPTSTLDWPSVADWLRAAGHDPDDPKTHKLPGYDALAAAVIAGRELAPDARSLLVSVNDLPRWMTRGAVLAALAKEVSAVRGIGILGLPPAQTAPASPSR